MGEQFITKARLIHDGKYDYSLVNYVNAHTKVKIVCPVHGVFEQRPTGHLSGKGCAECAGNIKPTTEQFITKAKDVHGDKYSYELTEYINAKTKVKIICPIHGVFEQRPNGHLSGKGCAECVGHNGKFSGIRNDNDYFITKAREVHGNKYSYELVEYVNNYTKVKIVCPVHGVFKQVSGDHLRARGCYECGIDNQKLTTEQFITKAKDVHGDKYSYELVDYIDTHTKVKIVCPVHGVFEQVPYSHLHNHGCPACAKIISQQELEFTDYIKGIYDGTVITNSRRVIPPYELDVYLPDKQVAFEYNGTYWHNEGVTKPIGYHDMKTDMCKAKDITLHHIWETDWMNNREEVRQTVKGLI